MKHCWSDWFWNFYFMKSPWVIWSLFRLASCSEWQWELLILVKTETWSSIMQIASEVSMQTIFCKDETEAYFKSLHFVEREICRTVDNTNAFNPWLELKVFQLKTKTLQQVKDEFRSNSGTITHLIQLLNVDITITTLTLFRANLN